MLKALVGLLLAGTLAAQSPSVPAGPGSGDSAEEFARSLEEARGYVRREDPVLALQSWRRLRALAPDDAQALVGAGRAHLLLNHPQVASMYAEGALQRMPLLATAHALRIDGLLRSRL